MYTTLKIRPGRMSDGQYTPPGDKSISHRALMISAMAIGTNRIDGLSDSGDVLATANCLRQLGVSITEDGDAVHVCSEGITSWSSPVEVLQCGNSGTTMRLMAGLLAAAPVRATLAGDESLTGRPMRRVVLPLSTMGAHITSPSEGAFAPLTIEGGPLQGIKWHLTVPSAQVKSAILLAAQNADGESHVIQDVKTRDHTERMLLYFGANIRSNERDIYISPGPLTPRPLQIPGDISSAAYFAVLAAATPGALVQISNVGLNPGRTGFLRVLEAMGAKVSIDIVVHEPEPIGTITVRGGDLQAVTIGGETVPGIIDEIPILAVAASVARGRTIIRGAQELRIKESDRIATIVKELCKMGVRARELFDGLIIEGGSLTGADVTSHGDHRIAMSLAVAASLCSKGETTLSGADAASVSYPGFFNDLSRFVGGIKEC